MASIWEKAIVTSQGKTQKNRISSYVTREMSFGKSVQHRFRILHALLIHLISCKQLQEKRLVSKSKSLLSGPYCPPVCHYIAPTLGMPFAHPHLAAICLLRKRIWMQTLGSRRGIYIFSFSVRNTKRLAIQHSAE